MVHYRKQLWGVFHYAVLSVLRELTVGHIASRRLHVTENGFPDVLPCSNGILLQDLNRLYLRISNTVAYRDPENGSLAIGQGQVYMPHKRS